MEASMSPDDPWVSLQPTAPLGLHRFQLVWGGEDPVGQWLVGQRPEPLGRGMSHLSLEEPGKLGATRERILPSSQMEPFVAQRARGSSPRNAGRRGTGACASSTRLGSPTVGPARSVRSVNGTAHQAQHPRRVSVLLHPRTGGSAPLFWRDWPRREQRRACIQVVRHQQVQVMGSPTSQAQPSAPPAVLSRAQRAHYRLSWHERLARNARAETAGQLTLKLFGIPEGFATWLGLTGVEGEHDPVTFLSEGELAASLALFA